MPARTTSVTSAWPRTRWNRAASCKADGERLAARSTMNAARLLVDSAPAALFGMIALWAAVSQRHWFVRTAIVAGMVLVTLLIPAFEIVIKLGLQSLLVAL